MENIELRDFIAVQLMSGKVNDFYTSSCRKNIAPPDQEEKWIHLTADEATQERIDKACRQAYKIADCMLEARHGAKITSVDIYSDGGSVRITSEDETYFIDNRLLSKTKGYVYKGYPDEEGSVLCPNQEHISDFLKKAVTANNKFITFVPNIVELLNSRV